VKQLEYKGKLFGIQVVTQEKDNTSKYSFIDKVPIEKRDRYLGTRISQGLFRTASGQIVNADVNGAGNILRKAFPNASWGAEGIEGVGRHPILLSMTKVYKSIKDHSFVKLTYFKFN